MKDVASASESDQTIAEINRLLRKGEVNLSPEEDRLLDLLSTQAESWEEVRVFAVKCRDREPPFAYPPLYQWWECHRCFS
jgi:hypothetical protein